jgi:uncharacterized protein
VAIASPFAYKIKKSVNFGFLDYSTLDLRQHFSEAEVLLNRRLCPDHYEGGVPIYGVLSLEAGGEIVEYAVKMRQLSEGCFLNQFVERAEVDEKAIDRMVEKLEPFYKMQTSSATLAEWGRIERLKVKAS